MNGLRDANGRIHRLLGLTSDSKGSPAGWSVRAFLAAGGLSFVATVLFAVDAFTALSTQGTVTGVISLTGLVLSYLGLLGLYPWLADQTPRLARAGVLLVGLPAVVLLALVLWGVSGHSVSMVPLPPSVIPSFGTLFVAVFFLFGLGIGLFGVASLRNRSVSPVVGFLLFVLAGTWFVLFGVSSVYGSSFPPWVDFVAFGSMAVILLAIGYWIRTSAIPPYSEDGGTEEPPSGQYSV